jgi:hypothetical protein
VAPPHGLAAIDVEDRARGGIICPIRCHTREHPMVDYDETGRVQGEIITARGRGIAGEGLGGVWWSFLLRGAFAGTLGLCALIWPAV